MPTAVPYGGDDQIRDSLRVSYDGGVSEALLVYRVPTTDRIAAFFADNLPAIGSAFPTPPGESLPVMRHRLREPIQRGQNTLVLCYFSSVPGGGGTPTLPTAPGAYTARFETRERSQEILADVAAPPNALHQPAQVEVAETDLIISVGRTGMGWLEEWVRIRNSVNANSVRVENFIGMDPSVGYTFTAGQLLVRSWSMRQPQQLDDATDPFVIVEYRLGVGGEDDFDLFQQRLDATGTPTGTVDQFQVYRRETWDYAQLWLGANPV